jgi:F-type H+-transporting ATPase subunit delta
MSDNVTIARPYAKALFNHALANQQLIEWSAILHDLAQAVLDPDASRFICNPSSAAELQTELLLFVLQQTQHNHPTEQIKNVIRMLTENKRLLLLPDISAQFEVLRAEQEKTVTVTVSSFTELTDEQEQHLIQSLSQRLQRHVVLDKTIDQSLLGGAVIRAGDLVIDGSVRGKLIKLGTELAA